MKLQGFNLKLDIKKFIYGNTTIRKFKNLKSPLSLSRLTLKDKSWDFSDVTKITTSR